MCRIAFGVPVVPEVHRTNAVPGGYVRDAVRTVVSAARELDWHPHGVVRSALPGPSGNVEFFVWLRRGPGSLPVAALDDMIMAAAAAGPEVR